MKVQTNGNAGGRNQSHNQMPVRDGADAKVQANERPRFQVLTLEERIAPARANGRLPNHNETLVRDNRFEIVALEERVAPGRYPNHNETLVRDRS